MRNFLIVAFAALLLFCLFGCSSMTKNWGKVDTKVDSTRVIKVDSSGTKNTKEFYTKETVTYYRDTAIYLPGNPYPVFIPDYTNTKESGQKDVSETANKNNLDSTNIQSDKKEDTKTVVKKGMDFVSKILVAGIIVLILAFIVLFLYVKSTLKIKSL